MSRHARPTHRTFGRLTLERLEAREVPAAYFWRPEFPEPDGSYSAAVAGNWRESPYVFAAYHTDAPDTDDDLFFIGGFSDADCTIPDQSPPAGANAFAGIHLLFGTYRPPATTEPPGFWHTVTVKDSFAVGTLTVQCGYVHQAGPATLNPPVPYAPHAGTLTITSTLNWTGGTLNSNNRPGYIDLAPGATGVAEPSFTNPGINQTVELGSTIRLVSIDTSPGAPPQIGSTLDILSGDYNIKNFAGIVVGEQCHLRLLPQPGDAPPPGAGNQPQYKASVELKVVGDPEGNGQDKTTGAVEIIENGTLTITPHNRPAESSAHATVTAAKGTIKNTGGKIILTDRVKATYGGKIDSDFTVGTGQNPPKYGASVTQSGADSSLSLQAGSELVTTYGVAVTSGHVVSPALGDPSPVAVIEATDNGENTYALLLGQGADISFPASPTRMLQLKGRFFWQGTVQVALSPLTTELHDAIAVTKEVHIKPQAKLKVTWPVPTHDADMAERDRGAAWHVVTSEANTNGIVGETNLTLITPDNTAVTMEVEVNPAKKILKVSKTSARVPKP